MAKSVARLAVSLVANTTQFRKRMKAAVRVIKRFGRALASVAKRAARFGVILAGVATAGMAIMVRRAFKLNDTLGKTADILGVTTEALAELQFAGELAGVEIGQLNKGLINMVRNVVDAEAGLGEAKDALELLRVDVQELAAVDPVTMFLKLADAARALGNQKQALAAFKDIFGRPGAGLSLLAQQTREELEKTFEFARKVGASIGRDTARSFEDANDAIRRMTLALEGMATQIGTVVAPVITDIANGIANHIGDTLALTLRGMADFAKKVVNIAAAVNDAIDAIIETITSKARKAADAVGLMLQGMRQGTMLGGAIVGAKSLADPQPTRAMALTATLRTAIPFGIAMDKLILSIERATKGLDGLVGPVQGGPSGLGGGGLRSLSRAGGRGGIAGLAFGVLARIAPPTIASGRIEFRQLEVLESIDQGIATLNRGGGVGLA